MTTRMLVGASLAGVVALPIVASAGVGLLGVMNVVHAIALVCITLLLMRESPARGATTVGSNDCGRDAATGRTP